MATLPTLNILTTNATPIVVDNIRYYPVINPSTGMPQWAQYSNSSLPNYLPSATISTGLGTYQTAQTKAKATGVDPFAGKTADTTTSTTATGPVAPSVTVVSSSANNINGTWGQQVQFTDGSVKFYPGSTTPFGAGTAIEKLPTTSTTITTAEQAAAAQQAKQAAADAAAKQQADALAAQQAASQQLLAQQQAAAAAKAAADAAYQQQQLAAQQAAKDAQAAAAAQQAQAVALQQQQAQQLLAKQQADAAAKAAADAAYQQQQLAAQQAAKDAAAAAAAQNAQAVAQQQTASQQLLAQQQADAAARAQADAAYQQQQLAAQQAAKDAQAAAAAENAKAVAADQATRAANAANQKLSYYQNLYDTQPGAAKPVASAKDLGEVTGTSVPTVDASTGITYYPTKSGWQQYQNTSAPGYTPQSQIQMTLPTIDTKTVNGVNGTTSKAFTSPSGKVYYPTVADQYGNTTGWSVDPKAGAVYQTQQRAFSQAQISYVDPAAYSDVPLLGRVQSVNKFAPNYASTSDIAEAKQNYAYQQAYQAKLSAAAAGPNFDSIGGALADFDKLVNKTVGWDTIATVVGGMVAGPWGATIANAAANAIQGETPAQILKSAALTFAASYGMEALNNALSETATTALEQAGSDIPQSVIDAANATSDPIGALNASQGFTNVDVDYLQSIGASQDLIDSAISSAEEAGFTSPEPVAPTETAIPPEPVAPTETAIPPSETIAPEPTGPVAPNELPITPVSEGPQLPVQPNAPTDLVSNGISDMPEGTIVNNGQDVVMANGKTVPLNDYLEAINSGQPISVDGQITTSYDTSGTVSVEAGGTGGGPIAPTQASIPEGYNVIENPMSSAPPGTTASDLGFQYNESTGEWFNPSTGAGYDASTGQWIAPSVNITPTQLAVGTVAVGGTAAALAAGGGGGAATTAAAAVPPATAPAPAPAPAPVEPTPVGPTPPPTTPVTPEPVAPTPTTPPPVTPEPVAPTPVEPTPVTPEPTPVTPEQPPVTPEQPPVTPEQPPVTPEPTPVTPEQPPVTPEQPVPPTNEPAPVHDYSTPYEGPWSDQTVLERFLSGTITYGDVLAGIAAGYILPSVLPLLGGQQQTPGKRSYGPLAPIQWGTLPGGLTNPGLNPGYMTFGGNPPQYYNTTNEVQSKYYWGQHPYMRTMNDLGTYNQIPEAPAQPFGIQQPRGAFDVNKFITENLGLPYQMAAVGSSPQYYGAPSYSTSAGGQTISPQVTAPVAPPQPAMAEPTTYTQQNLAGYMPQPSAAAPQPINMNFAPVTVPTNLPAWAPGQLDLTQPVAPYGTTPVAPV